MPPRFYSLRNYLGIAINCGATAGLAVAAYAIGNPWAIGISTFFAGGYFMASLAGSKKAMEKSLHAHPDIHELSPRLGKIARELYAASGLKADSYPIYDFRARADNHKDTAEDRDYLKKLDKTLRVSRLVPNAAALNLGEPVIMISEPLLAILNDEEEKAVLAHEFAHAAAKHHNTLMPHKILGAITRYSNLGTALIAAYAVGFQNFVGGIAAQAVTQYLIHKTHRHSHLTKVDKKELTALDRYKLGQMERFKAGFGRLLTLGYFSALSPAFAPIWAGIVTINTGLKVAEGSLSRSFEYQADKGATKLGGNPLALITALRKLEVLQERSLKKVAGYDASIPKPDLVDRAWKRATSTHPTTPQRISRLTTIARRQGYDAATIKMATHGPLDLDKNIHIPYDAIRVVTARLTNPEAQLVQNSVKSEAVHNKLTI